jgi:O-antigen ligase
MTKALIVWDRILFGALVLLTVFIPYSPVMIQAALFIMMIAWWAKRILLYKANPHTSFWSHCKLPYTSLQWPLLLLAVLILTMMPFSAAPALTLKKFFSRFIQQIILMYFAIEVLRSPKRLYILMTALLTTLMVVSADIFIQYFEGYSFIFNSQMLTGQRVTGPMRHPNDLGTLLVVVLPVVASLILTRKFWIPLLFNRKMMVPLTILCTVLFASLVIALGLTVSRGAWLAFVITIVAWGLSLKNARLTGVIVLLFVAFFWYFGVRCIELRTDITAPATVNQTVDTEKVFFNPSNRDVYWKTATGIISQFPYFGCGYNAYIQRLKQLNWHPQEYPHNSILHIAAEVGLIGLAGYLWLWIAVFLDWKRILNITALNRELHLLGLGIGFGLLAWLLHSFTDTAWESLSLSILWWLFIGVMLSLGTVSRQLDLKQGT